MIWQNGWAWAGLATLVLPVLIHLLGRGRARIEPFPTLRFLPASRLLPSKRTRVHDVLLLAIRAGILVAGVAALAQPLLRTVERRRLLNGTLVRAIIVDTSASMQRSTPSGGRAVVVARREAQRLADSAQVHILLETATPARALDGAIEWLFAQEGRGELDIVSDFQAGSLDAGDIARVPASDGIRLVRIATDSAANAYESSSSQGGREILARTTIVAGRSDVEWSQASQAAAPDGVTILAAPSELAGIGAARRAAASVGVPLPVDTAHGVTLVYPGAPERAAMLRSSTPLQAAWMSSVVIRVRSDSLLVAAAGGARELPVADSGAGLVVARGATGQPMVVAAQGAVNGRNELLLFPLVDAGSLVSAALIAATTRAMSVAAPVEELESSVIPDSMLAAWQRTPVADGHPAPQASAATGASDGRWFWVLALALLLIETWFRNRLSRRAGATPVQHAIT